MTIHLRPVCLAILAAAVPACAAAQAATVDQVLAALAEVVKDRARQVAAEAIAVQIKTQICTHQTISVKRVELRVPGTVQLAAAAPPNPAVPVGKPGKGAAGATEEKPLELWLGGRPECVAGGYVAPACKPDDVFVRSCQLLEAGQAPLTDPYYLKTLSRDTVDFLLRLSASSLSAEDYEKYGFAPLGDFVHSVLEQVTSKGVTVGDLAAPTLTLASQLSAGLPELVLEDIGARAETRALEATILPLAKQWVADGCPYLPDPTDVKKEPKLACAKNKDTAHWFVDGPAGCAEFLARTGERTDTYKKELFAEGTVVSAASEAPCEGADRKPWPEKGRMLCERARLTMNLHDGLTRVSCLSAMPEPARRSALREMVYLLLEQRAYREALRDLDAKAPGGVAALDAFLGVVRSIKLDTLPREELAYGVRLLGAYLAAVRDEPDAMNVWLAQLKRDLDIFAQRASEGDAKSVMSAYQGLLHGAALASHRRPAPPSTAELRDAVKDFILLPAVVVARDIELTTNVMATAKALTAVAVALQTPGEARSRLETTLRAFSRLADVLSLLAKELATQQVKPPAAAAPAGAWLDSSSFVALAQALKEASTALALAAERDWVGLGIRTIEQMQVRVEGKHAESVVASFRFVRVLLSMYQAQSVDEAKAIFQATLEDTASRGRRYDRRAWDAGALLGLRGGFQLGRTFADGKASYDRAGLYGVYAPFGIMTTRKDFGWMFYAIDLGSYLAATPNSAEEGKPRWQDAIRAGVTPFRRWKDVPLALGLGTDFRPPIASRMEWRVFLYGSLELPLYLIR